MVSSSIALLIQQ